MHAFWAAIEEEAPQVRRADMDAALAPDEWEALVRHGLLRPEGDAEMVEVSLADVMRALRALYGVEARGLQTPMPVRMSPVPLGWRPEVDGDREVALLVGRNAAPALQTFRTRKSLVLLPTARTLTDELRAKHPPGAFVGFEVLTEAITLRDGHLAREAKLAPFAPDLHPLSSAPPRAPAHSSAPSPAPIPALAHPPAPSPAPARALLHVPGAARWNEIHVYYVDSQTVRIDVRDVSHTRTMFDLGMAHARTRRPTRIWVLLTTLCEHHGVYHGRHFGGADATKKLLSRLGEKLEGVFGLEGPAFHPYRRTEGWQARFQASPCVPEKLFGSRRER